MIKRVALLTILLATTGLIAALFWTRGPSDPVVALPESAQARYFDVTVTTLDGREFQLPDKTVTCSLEFTAAVEDGVYNCPAPFDLESLLAPPQVSESPRSANDSALIEIDAGTIVWGLPASSWQTAQIQYGATLSSANVLLGEELTGGEAGHIENIVSPEISRGVHPSYFYYRAKTNASGYMGTEWLARGIQ